jgi:hypothetical protein
MVISYRDDDDANEKARAAASPAAPAPIMAIRGTGVDNDEAIYTLSLVEVSEYILVAIRMTLCRNEERRQPELMNDDADEEEEKEKDELGCGLMKL